MKQDREMMEMHPGVQDQIQKVAVVLQAPDDGEDHQLLAHLHTHLTDLRFYEIKKSNCLLNYS